MRHVGLNGSTESNQRGPGAFYINRPQRSMRAASRGAGRSIRGGGTSAVNHPKGSGHSDASSIRAFPSFSIYNSLVLVSIGLLLSLMFFWLLAVVITIMGHCLFLVFTMWLCSWKLWVKNMQNPNYILLLTFMWITIWTWNLPIPLPDMFILKQTWQGISWDMKYGIHINVGHACCGLKCPFFSSSSSLLMTQFVHLVGLIA